MKSFFLRFGKYLVRRVRELPAFLQIRLQMFVEGGRWSIVALFIGSTLGATFVVLVHECGHAVVGGLLGYGPDKIHLPRILFSPPFGCSELHGALIAKIHSAG